MDDQRLARALGWFSLGLGTAEVLFPKKLSRALGLRDHKALIRAYGFRELLSGVAILRLGRAGQRPGPLWARVAGDTMDLGTLFAALPKSSHKGRLAAAIASVAAVTALDMIAGAWLSKPLVARPVS